MNILHLTLEKKWYDMIADGCKTEEYREIKPHWRKRLEYRMGYYFDAISFRNGYRKDSRKMLIECKGVFIGNGVQEWGAPEKAPVYIIKLGKILDATKTA